MIGKHLKHMFPIVAVVALVLQPVSEILKEIY